MYHVPMRPVSICSRQSSHVRPAGRRTRVLRRGRVLVECCVALVLVAGAGTLLLLSSTTTALLVDSARLHDLVLREEAARVSAVQRSVCVHTALPTAPTATPRVNVVATRQQQGALTTLTVQSSWLGSALSHGARHTRTISTAEWCD